MTVEFVQELDRMSDQRRAEVTDVKRLADVRRGIVKNDRFAFAHVGRTVSVTFFDNSEKSVFEKRG